MVKLCKPPPPQTYLFLGVRLFSFVLQPPPRTAPLKRTECTLLELFPTGAGRAGAGGARASRVGAGVSGSAGMDSDCTAQNYFNSAIAPQLSPLLMIIY
jgi:hypothetical protein